MSLSEHDTKPSLVLVHNPCDYKISDFFAQMDVSVGLKEQCLFNKMPDCEEFNVEHKTYVQQLKNAGLNTVLLKDILSSFEEDFSSSFHSNPNFVYTRDALITIPWLPRKYILGRINTAVRENEPRVMKFIANALGLSELVTIPENMFLEGGDVIPFSYNNKRVLLVGYGRRTTENSLYYLREKLIFEDLVDEIIAFRLADWRINLDGGFVPISSKIIISNTESIVEGLLLSKDEIAYINPIEFFATLGYVIIHTTINDSVYKQTCNAFCSGDGNVFVYDFETCFLKNLNENDVHFIFVKGNELIKGTGGTRCMTRPIYL